MTNEERKEALLKLEHTYDLLCAQAKDLVYQMSREPTLSARNQFREKLISGDQRRTSLSARGASGGFSARLTTQPDSRSHETLGNGRGGSASAKPILVY